ncbi:MAG: hypothetical protein A4E53_00625 [Pelotomaculum sp. PtaB.Bin104]|nr:MAG: hypothetical protein A4E53_00625 [Pelotomaculum sp. PtaB.Bin104]
MAEGWISLHRKYAETELWLSEPFTRGQAWVDLLILANHKDGFIRVRGQLIPVKRGQVGWSQERLAQRWQWSRKKVSNFLRELEKTAQQIEQQKNNISTIITILNYDAYQIKEQQKEPQKHSRSTAEEQQRNTNNNGNNENNENKKDKKHKRADAPFVLPDFIPQETWNAYLAVRDKKKAVKTPYALNLIIKELLKIQQIHNHDPVAVLNKSIKSGWVDVFPLRDADIPKPKSRYFPDVPDNWRM